MIENYYEVINLKRRFIIILTLLALCAGGCAAEPGQEPETPPPVSGEGGTLVVYFSRVGNTDFPADVDAESSATLSLDGEELKGNAQLIAEWIADETGGLLFEIQTEKRYPADYSATTDEARAEQSEGARPALVTGLDSVEGYGTVYLVYPNWWGDLPMPVYSFLESYDFTGKTVNLFVTHEGSGFSRTVESVETLEPGASVVKGLSIRGGDVPSSETTVRDWVKNG